ncbi:MAG: hypothetical protein ACO3HA_08995 [Burkholderiales bacterium]
MPLLVGLLAVAALAYGCVVWHGTLLCVFIAAVVAVAGVFVFALLRELWILHQLKYM